MTLTDPPAPTFTAKQKVFAKLNDFFLPAIVELVRWDSLSSEWCYYVHFVEQDSRMDRWALGEDLRERRPTRSTAGNPSLAIRRQGILTRSMSQLLSHNKENLANSSSSSPDMSLQNTCDKFQAANTEASYESMESFSPFDKVSPSFIPEKDILVNDNLPHTSNEGAALSNITKKAHRNYHSMRESTSVYFSRPKNIHSIYIGSYEIEAWYFSPYPIARSDIRMKLAECSHIFDEETSSEINFSDKTPYPSIIGFSLHLCPYCVQPFRSEDAVIKHLETSCLRHPPGNEIYRDTASRIIVFEVDGKQEPVFSCNLALLSKLFLEHKALDHDMSPFLFFVFCHVDDKGCAIIGYFSKEKHSPDGYNLSCILTLPQYQGCGIGRFLIELSYELSRREGKPGSPERPLSDLGEKLYRSYWNDIIVNALTRAIEENQQVTIDYLIQKTAMIETDIITTLNQLNLLRNKQLVISDELIRRCNVRKSNDTKLTFQYVFQRHLLVWEKDCYDISFLPTKVHNNIDFSGCLRLFACHTKSTGIDSPNNRNKGKNH